MTEHVHRPKVHEERRIMGGGAIGMEVCECGALRSVVIRDGETITSDWEEPEEEDETFALPWDGTVDNDNEDP